MQLEFSAEPIATKNLLPKQGEAFYIANCFTPVETQRFFARLSETVEWKHEPITIFGKKLLQPRLTAWFGDTGVTYRYSGITMTPVPWTPELLEIKSRVEKFCGVQFNSALLNQYRDGQDSMGWHRDDEKELGPNPVIASVSFGAVRPFRFRHVNEKDLKLALALGDGSLLIMRGETQHHWYHCVSKTKQALEARINITFRIVKPIKF